MYPTSPPPPPPPLPATPSPLWGKHERPPPQRRPPAGSTAGCWRTAATGGRCKHYHCICLAVSRPHAALQRRSTPVVSTRMSCLSGCAVPEAGARCFSCQMVQLLATLCVVTRSRCACCRSAPPSDCRSALLPPLPLLPPIGRCINMDSRERAPCVRQVPAEPLLPRLAHELGPAGRQELLLAAACGLEPALPSSSSALIFLLVPSSSSPTYPPLLSFLPSPLPSPPSRRGTV